MKVTPAGVAGQRTLPPAH